MKFKRLINSVIKESNGFDTADRETRLDTYEQIWEEMMEFMRRAKDQYGWFEWRGVKEDPIGTITQYEKRGNREIAQKVLGDLRKQGYITIMRADELNNWDLLDPDEIRPSDKIAWINKVD